MAKFHKSKTFKYVRNFLLILVLVAWQTVFAFGPVINSQKAHAAPVCTIDTAGANDVPGQKDLTKLCVDYAGSPNTVATIWNWDETGTSGANTMDACNLFDTDGDGNANYAVCVTTKNDPATLQTTTTYSCGDARADRCTSTNTVISNGTTSCAVSQQSTDPFPSGAANPVDTQSACTIQLSTVGGASATLVDVCSFPSAQPNSDPSDCVIAQPKAGKLEVVKHLIPTTDSGLFNLQINSVTKAANVGNNGTTGEIVEPAGNNGVSYTVGETAGTNTSLASYGTTIVCKDLNGTGSTVASGSTTSTSVTVTDGVDIVCVITNTIKQATLILQKTVTNNNGGTLTQSNFPVAIGGTSAQWGSNSVLPGTYIVGETQQTGYQASSWGGDCTAGGSVTLVADQTKTCTITNDDIAPQLTVIKHVTNNNGGTATAANFTMNVTGTNVSSPSFAGAESPGTTVTLNAGTYSVDEGTAIGYDKSLGANCSGTIAIGESKTCTITNDDMAPNLTVNKVVVNPYGPALDPSAFPLFVDSISVTNGVPTSQFNAGSHTVTETQQTGYTLTGVTGNCSQNQQGVIGLTLSVGGNSTCTLTNTAIQPKLIVIKHVDNSNGGNNKVASNFTMTVTGNSATVPNFPGAESPGTIVPLNEGNYSVDELSHTGYTVSKSADCSGTIAIGETKTCTITNTSNPLADHGLSVTKGCESPTVVGDPYTCSYGVLNNVDGAHDTMTISALEDVTHSAGGDVPSGNVLSQVYLVATNVTGMTPATPATCTGPSLTGDGSQANPYHGATLCTLPFGSKLKILDYSYYTTTNADYNLPGHILPDSVKITWNDLCDDTAGTGNSNCNPNALQNGAASQTVLVKPAIHVNKYGPYTALSGETVTYTFVVTNTGDVPLSTLTVNDNIAGVGTYQSGDTNSNDKLDLTETWIYTKDFVIPTGQVTDVVNTVTVCGDYTAHQVCNTDTHTTHVLHPGIHVVKSGPDSAPAGSTVTYTFTVTNTGNTPLSSLTVNDDIAGAGTYQSGDTNSNDKLDLTETWIYTAKYTIPADQFNSVVNTVTVCGSLVTQRQVELLSIDSINDVVAPSVCAQDNHTLTIPKVLAETTPPPSTPAVLATTGQNTLVVLFASLFALGLTGATAVATRRTSKTNI